MIRRRDDPDTGDLLKSFEQISNEQLDNALAGVETCRQTWRRKRFIMTDSVAAKFLANPR